MHVVCVCVTETGKDRQAWVPTFCCQGDCLEITDDIVFEVDVGHNVEFGQTLRLHHGEVTLQYSTEHNCVEHNSDTSDVMYSMHHICTNDICTSETILHHTNDIVTYVRKYAYTYIHRYLRMYEQHINTYGAF